MASSSAAAEEPPKGLSYVLLGKQDLFGSFGSRSLTSPPTSISRATPVPARYSPTPSSFRAPVRARVVGRTRVEPRQRSVEP